jgi:DNA polymerase (family 10)
MSVQNLAVAAVFEEIADRLAIQGANVFRVRAYSNAARMLEGLGRDVKQMLERGDDLSELPGIGADLAGKIREVVETGKCVVLERLRREMPAAVTELLKVPGLGPKRVGALWHDLDVQTPRRFCARRATAAFANCRASAKRWSGRSRPRWRCTCRRSSA